MIDKVKYELARASGTLELLRDDEISSLIRNGRGPNSPRYRPGAETRMLCNLFKEPNNPEYIAEFEAHEEYVEACKAQVDAEFAEAERRYRDEIQNT